MNGSISVDKCENGYVVTYIEPASRFGGSIAEAVVQGEHCMQRRKVFITLEQLLAFVEGYFGEVRVPEEEPEGLG